MSEIERLIFEEDGETYEIYVQSQTPRPKIPQSSPQSTDDEYEEYGLAEDAIANLKDVHKAIRGYTKYAIGAFKNLSGVEVEEITLTFGMNISTTAGIPILTEGTAAANFQIEVKCKLPQDPPTNS